MEPDRPNAENELKVAIVGLAARLPGAADLKAFWSNLCTGADAIRFFSREELLAAGVAPALADNPHYVPARAVLPGLENFDAAFFGLMPRDAALLDPQQRLLLECAWEAMETSGCAREAEMRLCGVYAGVGLNTYAWNNLRPRADLLASTGGFQVMLGNDKDFCATRISYKLNLRGPSLAVQTACSSSLAAVHLACQALLHGECDLALAGGASALVPQHSGYLYEPGMILSPDGRCRPFDAAAAGTVPGSGAGFVLLKRLDDALAAGDSIRAVILGSAINNDGGTKMAYTAPSPEGQRAVIAEALGVAGVQPAEVGYIETHGTGTLQGDPVEFDALRQVYRAVPAGRCALGSVKSNLGHLDAAAGVVGLIKAVLALEHGLIPGMAHFTMPNPALRLEESPFFVPAAPVPWHPACASPRRAGVSSFGVGGTNAHVVLEQAPPAESSRALRECYPLVLSAKSASALDLAAEELAAHLEANSCAIQDVAFSLNEGRRRHSHARVVLAANAAEAVARLREPVRAGNHRAEEADERRAVFLLPGQGAQHPGMARHLYEREPLFREILDRCAGLVRADAGWDLLETLYGEGRSIDETAQAQPALLAVEFALAKMLMAWGVQPVALIGHSLGEWVAACLAGVMPLEDAVRLVCRRAAWMQAQPPGAMLGVALGEAALAPWLGDGLELAALNSPELSTISGPADAIAAVEARLAERKIPVFRLKTSHAFHSAMMEPVMAPLLEVLQRIPLRAPSIPFVSNLTGRWITAAEATDPHYWITQLRRPVRFAVGVKLLADSGQALIEVGPGSTLSTLAKHSARATMQPLIPLLPSPARAEEESRHFAEALGRIHLAGVSLDWKEYHRGEKARRVWLPAHPFQRARCWVDAIAAAPVEAGAEERTPLPEWLWIPGWRRAARAQPAPESTLAGQWAFIGADAKDALAQDLAGALRAAGATVLWDPTGGAAAAWRGVIVFERPTVDGTLYEDFFTLAEVARTFEPRTRAGTTDLIYLTRGLQAIGGEERQDPERFFALGAMRSIPQEYPALLCRHIDASAGSGARELIAELRAQAAEAVVAYRGASRWLPAFDRVAAGPAYELREGGVYLITGGLGGIGRTLARHLAQTCRAKLILVTRGTADASGGARVAQEIDAAGGEVLVATGDVTDEARMRAILAEGERRFGPIHGVIHAAGVAGGGVLAGKTRAAVRAIVQAKVEGTLVLERLLRGRGLDFLLLCSSVSSWLGGFGQADYCAANAFLDAFAERRSAAGERVCALAWDTWSEVGMAAETAVPASLRQAREEELRNFGIRPEEGVEIFQRTLTLGLPQVVVSTRNFASRYRQRHAAVAAGLERLGTVRAESRRERPPLVTPFTAPRDGLERRLAERWGENLGFTELGIHDNYFDLGGDSLKGITLAGQLEAELGIALHVGALFESPTIAQLAGSVAAKQAHDATAASPAAPCGGPVAVSRAGRTAFPMSSGQRRLWFLHRLDPGSTSYHMRAALHIRGALEVDALEAGHREIIRRHESLRTTFTSTDGEPLQIILPEANFELEREDLRGLSLDKQRERRRAVVRECTGRAFDLAKGPPLRGTLVRLGKEKHLWILTIHHAVSDAWSMNLLIEEISTFYRAAVQGEPALLPELPIQYIDYAVWQAEWLAGHRYEESLAWWRGTLAGAPPFLALPTDRMRPPVQTSAGARRRFQFSAELTQRLKAFAREQQATLFTTLLAGFTALLSRSSGSDDIVVGTPVAGRGRPELGRLIGFLVNHLVVRSDLSGRPTFRGHVERTQQAFLGALAHQDVPFDKLVEALDPPRQPSYPPLFQVVFGLLNLDPPALDWPGLQLELADLEHESASFDLTLLMKEMPGGLIGDLEYNSDVFSSAAIGELAQRFELLLQHAVAEPDRPLELLPLVQAAERDSLLRSGSGAGSNRAPARLLPELFAAQAASTPERVAVSCGGRSVAYGELEARAERLAGRLIALGLGLEKIVGLYFEPSIEMLVAMLAVTKAGGAYLPLDPAHPGGRVAQIIDDADPLLVLSGPGLDAHLPSSARVMPFSKAEEYAREDGARPHLNGGHAAYVIYTSGSTGQPKGVVVGHGELACYLRWAAALYRPVQGAGAPVNTPLAFDATVTSLLLPLACGGEVILLPKRDQIDALARLLTSGRELALVKLTPAHLEALRLRLGADAARVRARLFVIGGEALPAAAAAFWRAHCPALRMVNEYGPTETVVGCIVHELPAHFAAAGEVPIGRPPSDVRAYILDAALELAPRGVAGELGIGGPQVARGYLGRPGATAERFVPDRWGVPGSRLYLTGDLVRWHEDGTLEFLGRMDRQLKIRGFRIEPGEVEQALAAEPGVAAAVVLSREDAAAGRQLLAWVVPEPGAELNPARLRQRLAERLPDYMVPAAIVSVDALPLNSSGKLDRAALPAPVFGAGEGAAVARPQTALERQVAEIWQSSLGLPEVDVLENFFDLGGHSILLLKVQARLGAVLGREIAIMDLFRYTTVRSLAAHLERPPATQGAPALEPEEIRLARERAEKQRHTASRRAAAHA